MTRAALPMLLALALAACSATDRELDTLPYRSNLDYEMLTETPGQGRGAAVLLFSGGYAADLDWTIPTGDVEQDREPDGAAIARALVDAGFTVTRYSTIDRAQLDAGVSPTGVNALPFPESLELARRAHERFARQHRGRRLYLLGFSLGATRAALVADERASGVVLLSPAYLSRAAGSPRRLAASALEQAGLDAPGRASGWPGPGEPPPDRDGDGLISGWEIVAASPPPPEPPREEFPAWPIDRLGALGAPALAVFGGLDPIALHGQAVEGLPGAEVLYLPHHDHTLSRARPGGRAGAPMDPAVIERVARWLDDADREIARRERE